MAGSGASGTADRFAVAFRAVDVDGVVAELASDVELVSPIAGGAVFRGREDLRTLLAALRSSHSGFGWTGSLGEVRRRVLFGHARVGPVAVEGALLLKLDERGRIRRLTPHLRPWSLAEVRVRPEAEPPSVRTPELSAPSTKSASQQRTTTKSPVPGSPAARKPAPQREAATALQPAFAPPAGR